jgi:hypothetical protein
MEANQEEKKKKRGGFLTSLLVALIALLLCTSLFFGWQLSSSQDQVVVKEKDNQDKTSKIAKLRANLKLTEDMLAESKTGEAEKDEKLLAKEQEIKALKEKLDAYEKEGIGSPEEFGKIKVELWRLRSEIRELRKQNAELLAANALLKEDVQQKSVKINGLEGDAKLTAAELAQTKAKANLGAKILGRDFQAEGVRQRRGGEKNTRNPRSVERLRLTFTLNENPIAKAGLKTVYLRATAPDGSVLSTGGSTFPFQGSSLQYTDKLDIDYANADKDVFMYASPYSHQFVSGKYTLEAYMDGFLIGTAVVELK